MLSGGTERCLPAFFSSTCGLKNTDFCGEPAGELPEALFSGVG
jgi:hypothetical protein